ncbi:MAG: valine--tRNA ligase [Bacilli bacterium]
MALDKRYNPHQVEAGKYTTWKKQGYFKSGDKSKPPFSLVIPPPNVTGKLHLGHAWDNTIQDVITRYKKAQGFDVLWLPGMDHAGIATQAKVEQLMRSEGKDKYILGRDKFLVEMWKWKEQYASSIHEQWASLGLALDYDKEHFTLDKNLDLAVRTVFKKLFDKGLIYQGERIINIDPILKTALSNIEVIHKDVKGDFYYFRYPIVGSDESLIIATTRPETMFGDVAVFVNPKDERYTHFIGKEVINPADGRSLPIMADEYVDKEFGTGVMKCTPAHDPNDFNLSEKYHLEKPICMHVDATMNELAGKYVGLDRYECRKQLLEDIKDKGLFVKSDKVTHSVGHSERTNAVAEPYLSKQWFVKMQPLAEQALSQSTVEFIPKRFQKIFQNWMENVEDWCISRQLWWGHRIPVYYHKTSGEVLASIEAPKNLDKYTQDEDVLDTWFSSALWPFATLGWPHETDDYKRFYPNSVMVTGYDIIFFWVSRMIFQGLEFTYKSPFEKCVIHGLIRDAKGRKMTKSLNNGIDPIEIIGKHGVDALRYFLMSNTAPGQDTRYLEEKVIASSNYLNKIWNSARYVFNLLGDDFVPEELDYESLSPLEKNIIHKHQKTISSVTRNMDKYQFSMALKNLYAYVYDDFCSRYLEMSKVTFGLNDKALSKNAQQVLFKILKDIIVMIAPYTPFIAEELYLSLPNHLDSVMLEAFPQTRKIKVNKKDEEAVENLYQAIQDIRNYKVEMNLVPNHPLIIKIRGKNEPFANFSKYLGRFSFAKHITLGADIKAGKSDVSFFYSSFDMFIEEAIDKAELMEKLNKEKAKLEFEINRSEAMLANDRFVLKAPVDKVKIEKDKCAKNKELLLAVKNKIEDLK